MPREFVLFAAVVAFLVCLAAGFSQLRDGANARVATGAVFLVLAVVVVLLALRT